MRIELGRLHQRCSTVGGARGQVGAGASSSSPTAGFSLYAAVAWSAVQPSTVAGVDFRPGIQQHLNQLGVEGERGCVHQWRPALVVTRVQVGTGIEQCLNVVRIWVVAGSDHQWGPTVHVAGVDVGPGIQQQSIRAGSWLNAAACVNAAQPRSSRAFGSARRGAAGGPRRGSD